MPPWASCDDPPRLGGVFWRGVGRSIERASEGEGASMTQPLGEGATIRRDIRDAVEATGEALDNVVFIAREALTPAQVASLGGVECHLRAALAGLDAIGEGMGERIEPGSEGDI